VADFVRDTKKAGEVPVVIKYLSSSAASSGDEENSDIFLFTKSDLEQFGQLAEEDAERPLPWTDVMDSTDRFAKMTVYPCWVANNSLNSFAAEQESRDAALDTQANIFSNVRQDPLISLGNLINRPFTSVRKEDFLAILDEPSEDGVVYMVIAGNKIEQKVEAVAQDDVIRNWGTEASIVSKLHCNALQADNSYENIKENIVSIYGFNGLEESAVEASNSGSPAGSHVTLRRGNRRAEPFDTEFVDMKPRGRQGRRLFH
jgi:hypothetical protein